MSLAATLEDDTLPASGRRSPAEAGARRILFVAPSAELFAHLQEEVASYAPQWRIEHITDGEEALEALGAERADVLISDEQLAPMDGVTLLTRVRDRHPTTIRMILSQSASSRRPSLAAIVAHRVLAKPCEVTELSVMIRRSCRLHKLTSDTEAYRTTMAAAALPSRPGVYMELNRILSDPSWEPAQVAAAVERDVAMSAKVLQIANSALFGLTQNVTSVKDAVVYLGVETVRSLALTAEAFGKLAPRSVDGFSFEDFQSHAMLVARITAAMLPAGRAQQEAVTAALLHDIGKLVLISDGTSRWKQLNARAVERGVDLHVAERESDGVTHADVGAYLLSLWGLPDAIVEAVAHHHTAGSVPGLALDAVAAVHIANGLAHELQPKTDGTPAGGRVDDELVERLGLAEQLTLWRHLARQLAESASPAPEATRR